MKRRNVFRPVLALPVPALAAPALAALTLAALTASPAQAQRFSIEDVLSPGYPVQLVAAKAADRIAWIEYEEGRRNVYTAAAPGFEPVRLTRYEDDDGRDLSTLRISDDGSTLVFLRGHTPNREGWIANPASDPRGAERAVWAVSTAGGEPWRVVEAWNVALSPDGEWVAYAKDGAIYRAPVNPGVVTVEPDRPLFSVFGSQGSPVWSPDSRRLAFVSDRGDHSFVGIYDTDNPGITYLGPAVDRDTSPTWSPDGTRVAFIRRPGLPFGAGADLGGADPDDLPDGMTEARFAGGYDFSIWVGDARTGEANEVWHNEPDDGIHGEVRSVIWAGDTSSSRPSRTGGDGTTRSQQRGVHPHPPNLPRATASRSTSRCRRMAALSSTPPTRATSTGGICGACQPVGATPGSSPTATASRPTRPHWRRGARLLCSTLTPASR